MMQQVSCGQTRLKVLVTDSRVWKHWYSPPLQFSFRCAPPYDTPRDADRGEHPGCIRSVSSSTTPHRRPLILQMSMYDGEDW